jgi:hypothetical protein
MPPSHHEQLGELRQRVSQERTRHRGVAVALEEAKRQVQNAGLAVRGALAAEDEALAQRCRKALLRAEADVADLQLRVDAAELRVEAAEREADEFARQRAKHLLAELESEALAVADDSNQWAAQAAELKQRWTGLQQRTDELVGLVRGASPRRDCPASEHPFSLVLRNWDAVRRYAHTCRIGRAWPTARLRTRLIACCD